MTVTWEHERFCRAGLTPGRMDDPTVSPRQTGPCSTSVAGVAGRSACRPGVGCACARRGSSTPMPTAAALRAVREALPRETPVTTDAGELWL